MTILLIVGVVAAASIILAGWDYKRGGYR